MARRKLGSGPFLELLFAIAKDEVIPGLERQHEFQSRPLTVATDAYDGLLSRADIATVTQWAMERSLARQKRIEAANGRGVA